MARITATWPKHVWAKGVRNANGKPVRVRVKRGRLNLTKKMSIITYTSPGLGETNPDTTPDAFAFTDETDVALSTLTTSDSITITGITVGAAITISGTNDPQYQINSNPWTNSPGTIQNQDSVTVRHTSSAFNGVGVDTVLTIGGVSDTFTTVTLESTAEIVFVDVARPDDSGDGLTIATAKKTVAAGLALVTDGQTLQIQNGTYTDGLEISSSITIRVQAETIGGVEFIGGDTAWEAIIYITGSNVTIHGLIAHDPDSINSNVFEIAGSNNTISNCGGYNGGTYKHKHAMRVFGSDHLLEDCWFFGEGRYVCHTHGATGVTLRRVLVRWDQMSTNEPSEPNGGITMYSTRDSIVENCISIDYADPQFAQNFGGDFYGPQHLSSGPNNNNIRWLGNMVRNHDTDNDSGTNNNNGIRLDPDTTSTGNEFTDNYIADSLTAILISSHTGLIIGSNTFVNTGSNGSVTPDGLANIDDKYVDGVRGTDPLWPWANEALIKSELAKGPNGSRGWVTDGRSLEDYIKDL